MKRAILGFAAGTAAAVIFFSACNGNFSQGMDMGDVVAAEQAVSATATPEATATPSPTPTQGVSAYNDAEVMQVGYQKTIESDMLADVVVIRPVSSALTTTSNATPTPTTAPTPTPIQKTETVAVVAVVGSTNTGAVNDTAVSQGTGMDTTSAEIVTVTVSTTEGTGGYTALSNEYIDEVMRGINDSRANEGNPAVMLDARFCELAAAHAKKMAETGRIFHSDYRMIESVGKGTIGGMVAYNTGAFSAYHAPQIARDAEVTRVGIGGLIKDGEIFVCIVAE